jgi:hypothetical protein
MDREKLIIGGAILAAIIFFVKKKGAAADVGAAVGGAAVEFVLGAADTAISTPVYAIGDYVGVPRTELTECERAKLEGRTWDASFACPAGNFLKYLFS